MLEAGVLAPLVEPLGAVGLLFVLTAVLARARFAGAGLFTLASEYIMVEATGRAAVESVIAYAVVLIVFCELLLWSAELPRAATADRAIITDKLVALAATALAAALLAFVVLAAAGLRLRGGFESALLGTAAAVGLLALPWLLLRGTGSG